jgi:hypothetical protein
LNELYVFTCFYSPPITAALIEKTIGVATKKGFEVHGIARNQTSNFMEWKGNFSSSVAGMPRELEAALDVVNLNEIYAIIISTDPRILRNRPGNALKQNVVQKCIFLKCVTHPGVGVGGGPILCDRKGWGGSKIRANSRDAINGSSLTNFKHWFQNLKFLLKLMENCFKELGITFMSR